MALRGYKILFVRYVGFGSQHLHETTLQALRKMLDSADFYAIISIVCFVEQHIEKTRSVKLKGLKGG